MDGRLFCAAALIFASAEISLYVINSACPNIYYIEKIADKGFGTVR